MGFRLYLIPFCLLFLFMGSCTKKGTKVGGEAEDIAVAKVNGSPIYKKDLEMRITRNKRFEMIKPGEPTDTKTVLDELIADELLFQKAKSLGLDNTPQIKRMMIHSLTRDHLEYEKTVNDDELKAYYDANPEEFTEIRASHILVKADRQSYERLKQEGGLRPKAPKRRGPQMEPVPDTYEAYLEEKRKKVETALTRVQRGEDFDKVAKEYSEGPSMAAGGDLGYFTRDRMVPEFADVAFSLANIGDMSEIVQTKFGFHIIKLADRRLKPFENQKVIIKSKVLRKRKDDAYDNLVKSLRDKAKISVEDDLLKDLKTN